MTANHGGGYYDSWYESRGRGTRRAAKTQPVEGGGALGIVIIVVALAYSFAFFIAQIITTAFVVGAITYFLFLKLRQPRQVKDPPEIIDPSSFNDLDLKSSIDAMAFELAECEMHCKGTYQQGFTSGVRLTKSSDETRFDQRSDLGCKLNREIEAYESRKSFLETSIREKKVEVRSSIPKWRYDFDEWVESQTYVLLLRCVASVFCIGSIIFYVLSLFFLHFAWSAQNLLLWNPLPSILISPLIGGLFLAAAAYFLFSPSLQSKFERQIDMQRVLKWGVIEERWEDK